MFKCFIFHVFFADDYEEQISNLYSASNVIMSNFIECQVKMKAYPGELLILTPVDWKNFATM